MKEKIIKFLRWSERYTETDMLYAARGGFWITVGTMGIFIASFVKMIVFGRYINPEVYGIYIFIVSAASILSIFSLSGINISLIRAIAQNKEGTLSLAVKEKMKFSLIGSFLSLIVSGWYFLNQNHVLGIAFLVIAILLPFQSVFPIFSSFWRGRKNFEKDCKYNLISVFGVAVIVILVIILTENPLLIIIALFASQSLFNGLLLASTLKEKKNEEVSHKSITFGKNLTVINAIALFADQVDKIILWKFFGPIPLAIYSFAQLPVQKIRNLVPIVPLALPKIGERGIEDKKMKTGIMKKFKKLFLIFIPFTFIIIIISPYFYRLILPQYIESIPYFQAFSILLLLSPFSLLSASLVSEMKKKELYVIQTLTPLIKIILFLALIPLFQIWGIIFSILISQSIAGILSLYFFKKI